MQLHVDHLDNVDCLEKQQSILKFSLAEAYNPLGKEKERGPHSALSPAIVYMYM